MRKIIIINREDVNNPLHPFLFDQWLEELGIKANSTDSVQITIVRATAVNVQLFACRIHVPDAPGENYMDPGVSGRTTTILNRRKK